MAHGWANGPMVRVHQRLDQRGGKIFENVHDLAAAWPWTFANVYRGCMGHVRLSDSAGAQPSHEHHFMLAYRIIQNHSKKWRARTPQDQKNSKHTEPHA